MAEHLVSLLDGLGNGAVFAALALALVVTFRSSGVVNFATGAIALYVAYTYALLREGELLVPIPGFDAQTDVGSPLGFAAAFIISMLIAAALGVVLYLLVFRPLRAAPPVAKAVASIGVMLVIQAVLAKRLGTSPVSTGAILPDATFTLFGQQIRGDRIWFAAVIVAITAGLAALFRFTRFGLATRAAAETEKGALVTGLNPDRIALANWAISAMVAGVSGILISPLVPLIPISYTLFIVPALAAALVGRFTYVVPAVAAGLAIGMIQSELVNLQSDWTWLPSSGMPELVPLALILIVLVVRGQPLPSRGAVILQTLGRAPRPRMVVLPTVVGVAAGAIALFAFADYRSALTATYIFGIISLSWVVVTGYAGQLSLAQLTLAGVGAFTLARVADDWGVPFPLGPLLGGLVAMVIGVVIGLPALRIRGLPVAVVTLALAVTVERLWFANNDWNGGAQGAPVSPPSIFGYELGTNALSSRIPFGLLCLGVLTVVAVGVAVLRISPFGAAMLAVRANERSAAAAGIDVARTKIVAFAIGSFIAGVGGSLLAYQQGAAVQFSFSAVLGIAIFATAYLAGITSVSGGIVAGVLAVGGVFYTFTDRNLQLGEWYATLSGLLLVLTIILNPEGIVGPAHVLADRLRRQRLGEVATIDPMLEPVLQPASRAKTTSTVPAAAAAAGRVLLSLRGVGVRYGGVVAVNDVSLDVPEGLIVGLIGPNGAGKTTLMDAISGFTPSTGSVEFEGVPINGVAPFRRVRRGLGRTFQGIELYEDLTVEENISVGQEAARHGGDHVVTTTTSGLDELIGLLHLDPVRDRPVSDLSAGYRQLVSIGRALAGRPRLVLLDEPAGGLDSDESLWLGERLRAIRDSGVTVVMIDHDMHLVLGVCDLIHVLDLGSLIASGTPAQIQGDPKVAAAYLGSTHAPEEIAG